MPKSFNDIKVSVIIPVYRAEQHIERCSRSLFEQSMAENIEFIFVDDCSPDNSVHILNNVLEAYPKRKANTIIVRLPSNQGIANARQRGLEEAHGEYIIHCDSDDWVDKDIYKTLYDTALSTRSDVVMCDYVLEFGNKKCRKHITKSESPVEVCCNLLRGRIHNGLWNKLIRREIYDKVTPWFIPNMNLFEDVALVPRLIINSKSVAFIAKPLYHYSQENTLSITHKWEPKHIDDMVAAVEILKNGLPTGNIDIAKAINQLKFNIRINVLKEVPKLDRHKYINLFPDINTLNCLKQLGLLSKIRAYLIIRGHIGTANSLDTLCSKILMHLKQLTHRNTPR